MELEEKMRIVHKTINHNSVKYTWVTTRSESILEVVNLISVCREKLDKMFVNGVIDYNETRILFELIDCAISLMDSGSLIVKDEK